MILLRHGKEVTMGLFDRFINTLAEKMVNRMMDPSNKPVAIARAYYGGDHPEQLKVRQNQFNDNIALNFARLIAQRIVSQMLGKGITLDFEGETETEQEKWVNLCLDANKQEVLLQRGGLSAGLSGTGYFYTMPGGAFGEDNTEYPRVVLVDPLYVRMETLPEDFEIILRYIIEYRMVGPNGREMAKRRVIEQDDGGSWWTRDYVSNSGMGGNWDLVQEIEFVDVGGKPLPFAPMLHWQNLPSIDSAKGEPDITTNILALQDRINFLSSNISKLIRFYAHPMRFSRLMGQTNPVETGPDEMINFQDPNGGVFQLDQLGDLAGSQGFLKTLRQSMFDTARVVDIDSLQDKLGALTNFGLRVLYQDNLAMIATKRELFGDMVEELARRLQMMNGMQPVKSQVVWPDMLPTNQAEQVQSEQALLAMGVMSKQTIATQHGLDFEAEQQRMDAEQQVMYDNTPAQ